MSKPSSPPPLDLQSASVDLILEKISPGQTIWMQVKGTSMVPTLRLSDEVEVEILDPQQMRFADLVVLETPEAGLVIHRFFGWRDDGHHSMVTKGDASPRFDPPWPDARFLGRVRTVRTGGCTRSCRRGWLLLGAARSLLVGFRAVVLSRLKVGGK